MKSLKEYLPESFLTELTDGPGDSNSPISGAEAEGKPNPAKSINGTRELVIGDPVTVRRNNAKGVIDDVDENDIVIVDLKDHSKRKFHIADLQYDDYAKDNDEEDYRHELENFKKLAGY